MIGSFSIMDYDSMHESGKFYKRSYKVHINCLHIRVDVLDNTIRSKKFPELQACDADRVVESFDLYGGRSTDSGRCAWLDANHHKLREALSLFEKTIQGMLPGLCGAEWVEQQAISAMNAT